MPGTQNPCAGRRRAHDDAQHIWRARPTIDEIADEDEAPSRRRRNRHAALAGLVVPYDAISELFEQRLEFVGAPMHVADDVEWPHEIAAVGRQGLSHDLDLVTFAQHVNGAHAVTLKFLDDVTQRP